MRRNQPVKSSPLYPKMMARRRPPLPGPTMIKRKYLFPRVIEMNYQAGRRLGVNVYLIDGGSEFSSSTSASRTPSTRSSN